MEIRPLNAQFPNEVVVRVRNIQHCVLGIQQRGLLPRYLSVEISRCLEAGVLLASLQVACTALEFAVRRTLVNARIQGHSPGSHDRHTQLEVALLREAEDDRQLSFHQMLDQLVSCGVLTTEEAIDMRGTYRIVRIPLHHGVIGRYVRERSESTVLCLMEELGFNPGLDSHGFEAKIEEHALREIETVLTQIEVLCRKRAV